MSVRNVLAVAAAFLSLLASACASTSAPAASEGSASLASASATAFPVTLDTPGGPLTLERQPQRIVSLSASSTQMLYAVGAGPQVVAVDKYSTEPASAPRTNLSALDLNVEAASSFDPDLVVVDADYGGVVTSLAALKIPVLIQPAATTVGETYREIELTGRATGHLDQAQQVVREMKARIQQIVASVPKPTEPLTVYHELDDNHYSVTSATFIGQVYEMFGLQNIADAAGLKKNGGYPQLSSEFVIQADPQIIVLADTVCCKQSAETVSARDGWDRIAAVQHGQIVSVDDSLASQWGPSIVELIDLIGRRVRSAETEYGVSTS